MSDKYGVGINIYSAGALYEVMCGVRNRYDKKRALYTNSLFLNYIKENGLNVSKNGFCRDIITVDFNYGSVSFEEERARLEAHIREDPENEFYKQLLQQAYENQDRFDHKSADEIRELFYKNGCEIKYGNKTVKYRMLCRSPGAAKKGSCTFIRKSLWKKAHDFLYMGMKLPKKNAKIIEASAYAALSTSGIIDTMVINPEDILILKDHDSFFRTKVIDVQLGEDGHCKAVHRGDYEVSNTCFDGQALMDDSIFPEWATSYVLLRNHFCKAAAFHCHLQQFFRDYYEDAYETATIKDMWGNEHLVKDIKLLTTKEAMKWTKFGISYEYWCQKVHENSCVFGIVKTVHPSKLGNLEKMSYQMVNSCGATPEQMESISGTSRAYIERLKSDTNFFVEFLRKNENFSNDYRVLADLYEQDHTFEQSEYFRYRRKKIIFAYTNKIRGGKVLQNAENETIVGSPYAMLLYAVGEDPELSPEFEHEDGAIQVYTDRFEDGEYLIAFRSPLNSGNNIMYFHNQYSPYIRKYFELRGCIAVNMIRTDAQDRANGLTNWPSAQRCA